MLKEIVEAYPDEEILKAIGFDEAVIGISWDIEIPRLVYSVDKCIEVLMKDMSHDEAHEYFNFNVSGACMGERTPIWVYTNF